MRRATTLTAQGTLAVFALGVAACSSDPEPAGANPSNAAGSDTVTSSGATTGAMGASTDGAGPSSSSDGTPSTAVGGTTTGGDTSSATTDGSGGTTGTEGVTTAGAGPSTSAGGASTATTTSSSTGGTGGTVDEGPPAEPEGVIPNEEYPPTMVDIPKEQWPQGLVSPTLESEHHNQPSVINGYLQLTGNSRFSIYDISDPSDPEQLSVKVSDVCCGEAEGHQVSFAKYDNRFYTVTINGHGVDIWDITDVRDPQHIKAIAIDGINFGDFTEAVWGVYWQGSTLYVGGTNTGVHVFDVSDPANPMAVGRVANVGGVNAGPLFAIGNILVVTTPKDNAGIATLDISDPHKPLILDSISPNEVSYIGGMYGHHAYLLNPIRIYDVLSDPTNITQISSGGVNGYFEYMSFQDGFMFAGRIRPEPGATKINVKNPKQLSFVRDIYGRRDLAENDDQFTVAIGNLLVMSDDQLSPQTNRYAGTVIAVHDTAPDTTPPSVDTVIPKDGATGQAVTSRIGLSFTDNIELATVDTRSFIVRPMGGEPLQGTWGVNMSILNFDPKDDLQPGTTYEVILPAGGIKDYVGNGIAEEFRSTFTTK